MHSELDAKTVNTTISKSLIKKYTQKFYSVIVIDFSSVQFIDEAGCKCLKEITKEYKNDEVRILFANCNGTFIHFFYRALNNRHI